MAGTAELRREYHQKVIAAIERYLAGSGVYQISSSRDESDGSNAFVVRFTFEDGEAFATILREFEEHAPNSPRESPGGEAARPRAASPRAVDGANYRPGRDPA